MEVMGKQFYLKFSIIFLLFNILFYLHFLFSSTPLTVKEFKQEEYREIKNNIFCRFCNYLQHNRRKDNRW